jgi:hypothetical protein
VSEATPITFAAERDGSRFEAGQEIKARKKAYPQMSQMNADEQEIRK